MCCICACRPVHGDVNRLGETATYIMLVGQVNTDSHSIAGVLVVCTHQALWVAGVDDGVTAHCWSGYKHYCIILVRHLQEEGAKGRATPLHTLHSLGVHYLL